jgi:hypothetical protein
MEGHGKGKEFRAADKSVPLCYVTGPKTLIPCKIHMSLIIMNALKRSQDLFV